MLDPSAFRDGSIPVIGEPSNEPEKFKLKLHGIEPEAIIPNGDRYLVETLEVDDVMQFGQLLVIVQDPNVNPRDAKADPQVENRGIIAAVIVQAGNGHLLGLADHALVLSAGAERIERAPADVPMFFEAGDVVLIDRSARGRPLRYANRELRLVNQIDVLARIEGIRLVRKDGVWTQGEAAE